MKRQKMRIETVQRGMERLTVVDAIRMVLWSKLGSGRHSHRRARVMKPWKLNLLLLYKFAYSRIILWGLRVKSNWSEGHVFYFYFRDKGNGVLMVSLLRLKEFLIWVFYFILLLVINFICRVKSVISTIPTN